jgi:hypothetical protein
MSIYLYLTENMVMTRKIGFKSLIFQSVSMAMVYGFSGSDLEPVSSNSFDIVDLMIIIGMCILIPYTKCCQIWRWTPINQSTYSLSIMKYLFRGEYIFLFMFFVFLCIYIGFQHALII